MMMMMIMMMMMMVVVMMIEMMMMIMMMMMMMMMMTARLSHYLQYICIGIGSVLMILNSLLLNNIWNSRMYPIYWHYWGRFDDGDDDHYVGNIWNCEKCSNWFNCNSSAINNNNINDNIKNDNINENMYSTNDNVDDDDIIDDDNNLTAASIRVTNDHYYDGIDKHHLQLSSI